MMAIQLSEIGKIGGGEPVKATDRVLGSVKLSEYVCLLKSRMDKGILTHSEAVKARDFLGDLDGQYRYVLKFLDDYITDKDRLLSKDGANITKESE
jgi:hypothetical protein